MKKLLILALSIISSAINCMDDDAALATLQKEADSFFDLNCNADYLHPRLKQTITDVLIPHTTGYSINNTCTRFDYARKQLSQPDQNVLINNAIESHNYLIVQKLLSSLSPDLNPNYYNYTKTALTGLTLTNPYILDLFHARQQHSKDIFDLLLSKINPADAATLQETVYGAMFHTSFDLKNATYALDKILTKIQQEQIPFNPAIFTNAYHSMAASHYPERTKQGLQAIWQRITPEMQTAIQASMEHYVTEKTEEINMGNWNCSRGSALKPEVIAAHLKPTLEAHNNFVNTINAPLIAYILLNQEENDCKLTKDAIEAVLSYLKH